MTEELSKRIYSALIELNVCEANVKKLRKELLSLQDDRLDQEYVKSRMDSIMREDAFYLPLYRKDKFQ